MLKRIRIALAAVFFIGITLLLAGIGQQWWGWMAKLQFLPACLVLNVVGIVALVLLTFVCGLFPLLFVRRVAGHRPLGAPHPREAADEALRPPGGQGKGREQART